ncbi:MAG TPA: ferric reductase-like transmembrane domain-containing protein [Dehalococcoidia bacterium]|nr:ferric reductase-like transmembrane domain-containing protein [Dehalococcoidia bacterium]
MDGGDQAFWYLTRATGLVSFVLLTGSVALGLLMTGKAASRLRRNATYDLHRFVALLTLILTVVHTFIVLPDAFIGFSVWELLVPFASPYRATYMALGTLSLYLMGVVIATFYMRPFVPYSAWRAIHYATFAVFVMALVHGIGAGSDGGTVWAQALYWASGGLVLALLGLRVAKSLAASNSRRVNSPSALGVASSEQTPV